MRKKNFLNRILQNTSCPQGKIHGMDLSEESIAFANKCNAKYLDKRCLIRQGNHKKEELHIIHHKPKSVIRNLCKQSVR